MYIPKNLEVKDPLIISELIAENGFGTLISADLNATHLPLIYEPNDDGLGLLFGHVAESICTGKLLRTTGFSISILSKSLTSIVSVT